MSRVLVVSSDVVGERMAGPGIRALELARALALENDVTLAVPGSAGSVTAGLRTVEATRGSLEREAAAHEVAVVQGSALSLAPGLARSGAALVVDLYDPFLAEGLELHADLPEAERLDLHRRDLAALRRQCLAGDFFLCASERQRLYWLGVLSALGRVNPLTFDAGRELRSLLAVVPFGVPAEPPRRERPVLRGVLPGVGTGDFVVLWGGGIWNWLDPLTLVRAAAALAPELPALRVVFLGGGHPNPAVPRMRMAAEAERLARELGVLDRHVFFRPGWVPYAERGAYLAEADAGVSLHLPGIEADLAFRTRVLDYLWAGLPVVLTAGDATAELAAGAGAGLTVPPGNAEVLARVLRDLAGDPGLASRCREGSRTLAGTLRWDQVAAPLLEFCRQPRRSPDRALADAGESGAEPPARLGRQAWRVLRRDGPSALARRTLGYLRRRR